MATSKDRKTLELTEYKSCFFPKNTFSDEVGELIWKKYSKQLTIQLPSFKTNQTWEITPQGWIGYLPITKEVGILIKPKVSLDNIFGMLEYAYRFNFSVHEDLFGCSSLEEFYNRLANILSKRIRDRARKGLYKEYLPKSEILPFIRGRLNIKSIVVNPCKFNPHCDYEENTYDIEDNRILNWTLYLISRNPLCEPKALSNIRAAYKVLHGYVSLLPCIPKDCLHRFYNRLNNDYQQLHALCRFFLENSGPTHEIGEKEMLPFLINMSFLYEQFVAEWLKANEAELGFEVKSQVTFDIDKEGNFSLRMDIVLLNPNTHKPVCVLDTKYKTPEKPSPNDIAKIVLYAHANNCKDAVLVYPIELPTKLNENFQGILIRNLTFNLEGDLDEAGMEFIKQLRQNQ
ncbi:restriction endonuclease [bacterium]|nr:restriction endonuclease [bacterium]